jgi:hypothetical protein
LMLSLRERVRSSRVRRLVGDRRLVGLRRGGFSIVACLESSNEIGIAFVASSGRCHPTLDIVRTHHLHSAGRALVSAAQGPGLAARWGSATGQEETVGTLPKRGRGRHRTAANGAALDNTDAFCGLLSGRSRLCESNITKRDQSRRVLGSDSASGGRGTGLGRCCFLRNARAMYRCWMRKGSGDQGLDTLLDGGSIREEGAGKFLRRWSWGVPSCRCCKASRAARGRLQQLLTFGRSGRFLGMLRGGERLHLSAAEQP